MDKRSISQITTWFEGDPPDVKAYATVDKIPGVIFTGDCMSDVFDRVLRFYTIDVMEEWNKDND